MANRSPARQSTRQKSSKDRRAPEGAAPPLRRLKGLLVRPLSVERRDGKVAVVLAERRRARPVDDTPTPSRLCTELSDRLLAHEAEHTSRAMRQLVFVHDMLERKGWAGAASMSGRVLAEALDQLEWLAADSPSPLLEHLITRLRPLQVAATLREESDSRLQDFDVGASVSVTESDFAEFESAERDWAGTVPDGLSHPERERDD